MWNYERRLEYPVNIKRCNPQAAMVIMSQYGGLYSITSRNYKEVIWQASQLLHLSGFPCHTSGVWSQRILPPQKTSLYHYNFNEFFGRRAIPLHTF